MTLDELVGRVVEDDYERFTRLVKKYVPSELRFGKDDDVTAVVGRYISFVDSLGLTGELKLKGLQDIFLAAAKDE